MFIYYEFVFFQLVWKTQIPAVVTNVRRYRGEYWHSPMVPYSEGEARAAFQRSLAHHRRHGW